MYPENTPPPLTMQALSSLPVHVLDTFLRTSPDPVFVVDRQGCYLYVGEAGARALGLTAADMVGKTNAELGFAPEMIADLMAQTEQVFCTRQTVQGTSLVPTLTGLRVYEHTFSPICNDQGEVIAMLCVARDVSEVRHAQSAQQAIRERYSTLVELSPDAIFVNQDNAIAFTNPAFVRMVGAIDAQQVLGKSPLDFIHPQHHGLAQERIRQMLTEQKNIPSVEEVWLRLDGSPVDVEVAAAPCQWGERPAIQVVVRDVTERREAARERERLMEELAEREAQFRALTDANILGIFVVDLTTILEANDCFLEMVGFTRADLEAQALHWPTMKPPEYAELDAQVIARQMAGGECAPFEKEYIRKDGSRVPILIGSVLLHREPLQWLCFALDLSAKKQAESEADLLRTRLHRAVYEASHRIKNNLQTLNATVDMVLMDNEETVSAEELRRLRAQIGAIATTHDLLTYETRADGTADRISAKTLLERTLTTLQQTTNHHRLHFILEDVQVPVKTATSLALIVNEAVSNGIKHGGQEIEITFRAQAEQGCLEICDDGPGFPEDFDAQRSANTGLELLMTLTRLDLGGAANFANRAEGGARVIVTFPLVAEP